MARYIDADRMREDWLENGENEYVYDTNAVLQSIDEQPTADVVEVVHGEWERIPYSFAGGYRCSCCGCKSLERHWKYCPECGAVMDGKKE